MSIHTGLIHRMSATLSTGTVRLMGNLVHHFTVGRAHGHPVIRDTLAAHAGVGAHGLVQQAKALSALQWTLPGLSRCKLRWRK